MAHDAAARATPPSRSVIRRTRDLPTVAPQADILVVAIGRAALRHAGLRQAGRHRDRRRHEHASTTSDGRAICCRRSPRRAEFAKKGSLLVGDVHPRGRRGRRRADAGAGRRRPADHRDADASTVLAAETRARTLTPKFQLPTSKALPTPNFQVEPRLETPLTSVRVWRQSDGLRRSRALPAAVCAKSDVRPASNVTMPASPRACRSQPRSVSTLAVSSRRLASRIAPGTPAPLPATAP